MVWQLDKFEVIILPAYQLYWFIALVFRFFFCINEYYCELISHCNCIDFVDLLIYLLFIFHILISIIDAIFVV